jgi:hypothetical protein
MDDINNFNVNDVNPELFILDPYMAFQKSSDLTPVLFDSNILKTKQK